MQESKEWFPPRLFHAEPADGPDLPNSQWSPGHTLLQLPKQFGQGTVPVRDHETIGGGRGGTVGDGAGPQ